MPGDRLKAKRTAVSMALPRNQIVHHAPPTPVLWAERTSHLRERTDCVSQLHPFARPRTAILSPLCTLTPTTKLVLIAALEYVQNRLTVAFPSQAMLAADTGYTERTVRDSIKEAMHAGWVTKHGTDLYSITVPVQSISLHNGTIEHTLQELGSGTGNGLTPLAITPQGAAEIAKAEKRALQKAAFEHSAGIWFQYWRDRSGRAGYKPIFDDKRLKLAVARLRENGGDVSEGLYAVDGSQKDDLTMGRKNGTERFDRFEILFRDRAHVERYAEIGGYRPGMTHPFVEQT